MRQVKADAARLSGRSDAGCAGAASQLKIAVQAPPIEGRANSALVAFLVKTFGLPKNQIELVSGELSRSKVFLLRGVTLEKAESVLAAWR
jgi:hypothetical protein